MIEILSVSLFIVVMVSIVLPYIANRMTYGPYIPCMDILERIKGCELNQFDLEIISCDSAEVRYIAYVPLVWVELWSPYIYYISIRDGSYILITKGSKEAEWIKLKYNELNKERK